MKKLIIKIIITILFVLIVASIIFTFSLSKIGYDTALYHLHKIRWIVEYGNVPGLANLDGRLGFYSLYFYGGALLVKLTNHVEWLFYINLIIYLIFLIYVYRIISKNEPLTIKIIAFFALFILTNYLNIIKSIYQDIGGLVLVSILLIEYLKNHYHQKELNISKWITGIVILISLKFSYLFIVIVIPFGLLKFLKQRKSTQDYLLLIFSSILVLLIIYHNYIASGWILYPNTLIDIFDVDWKVPAYLAENNNIITKLFARNPSSLDIIIANKNSDFITWFNIWWLNQKTNHWLYYSTILSWLLFPLLINKGKEKSKVIVVYVATIISTILWFFSAPSFRFGIQWIFISISLLIYSSEEHLKFTKRVILEKLTRFIEIKDLIVVVLLLFLSIYYMRLSGFYSSVVHSYPKLSFNLHVVLPKSEFVTYQSKLKENELIYVPKSGERVYYPQNLPVASRLFIDNKMPFINDIPRYRGNSLKHGFFTDSIITVRKELLKISDCYSKTE